MVRCTNFPFIVLLVIWRITNILGVDETLSIDDTACVGNNITLKYAKNSFASATWSRNGSTVLTNCASSGFCSNDKVSIDGITYYFTGTLTGTQVSFQIQPVEDGIKWTCNDNGVPYDYTFNVLDKCPISQLSSSIVTEGTTNSNSVSELSNLILTMISDSTTTTIDISAFTLIILHTGTTNIHSNTQTTHFYLKAETTTLYSSTGTSNFEANTQTDDIQTNILRITSNSMSTYQRMFVTTTATDISGSFEIPIQTMTDTFTMTGFSISSYNELSLSTFETSTVFPQTVSETSTPLSVDTVSDSLIHTLRVSSGSLTATDFSEFSILSMTISPSYVGDSNIPSLSTIFFVPSSTSDTTDSAFEITNVSRVSYFSLTAVTVITPITTATVSSSAENTALNSTNSASLQLSISENKSRIQQTETNTESPLMSTTFIDHSSYSSKIEDQSFSSHQYLSESSVTLPIINVSRQLTSAIIETMNHSLVTFYLDDTSIFIDDFTDGYQTFSQDYAISASTSLDIFYNLTDRHLSLQNTEFYHETMQIEFLSYVTTPLYESHTDNAATGIYSKEIATSGKSDKHTSVKPSQTLLASMNGIQDSTTEFQSTYVDPNSQSNNEVFSSEISEYLLSTFQSANFFLPNNTKANPTRVDSYMGHNTNMLTFESQAGILSMDLSLFTNPSSIQTSTILIDFKTTLLTTTISYNTIDMSSMIKPSSKQTDSAISYSEIETSFKNSKISADTFSSGVFESTRTLSTNTVQNGLAEKSKNIIVISSISAILTIIVVIFLIIFVYLSKTNTKPYKEVNKLVWSNSSHAKISLPDNSFTGTIIHPLLNTSTCTTPLKVHPYEHNWHDIV